METRDEHNYENIQIFDYNVPQINICIKIITFFDIQKYLIIRLMN